jgi:transposase
MLPNLVAKQPRDFGWSRSTWSVETVANEVQRQTGVGVSRTHMGRLLHKVGCRRVRPKPTVALAPADRAERMQALREELWQVPSGDVVLFCDEVDIHLNPKVGPDWVPAGQRKLLVTPGQNCRWYLSGAYNPHTKNLVTVDGPKKTSDLFIRLVCEVARRYGHCGIVHLVVDNYVIHHSKRTQEAVEALGGKIQLHFLPPYSPDDNPIERVWWDLHAHVTRNHRHANMETLLEHVNQYIRTYSRSGGKKAGQLRLPA